MTVCGLKIALKNCGTLQDTKQIMCHAYSCKKYLKIYF